MDFLKDLALLIGRICISALFVWAAMEKLINWKGTVEYMKKKRLPLTSLALSLAVLIQIVGGLSICLGYQIRFGALLLILFIVPAALRFHDFWNLEGAQRITEKTLFMKDVAVFGSLLLILVWGGGRFVL
ncbi:MAG: DoxX family protein [Verrucomicrobia bacterium]|nr:DoxX family protein [Verrucomicrobiota bacterium]